MSPPKTMTNKVSPSSEVWLFESKFVYNKFSFKNWPIGYLCALCRTLNSVRRRRSRYRKLGSLSLSRQLRIFFQPPTSHLAVKKMKLSPIFFFLSWREKTYGEITIDHLHFDWKVTTKRRRRYECCCFEFYTQHFVSVLENAQCRFEVLVNIL